MVSTHGVGGSNPSGSTGENVEERLTKDSVHLHVKNAQKFLKSAQESVERARYQYSLGVMVLEPVTPDEGEIYDEIYDIYIALGGLMAKIDNVLSTSPV